MSHSTRLSSKSHVLQDHIAPLELLLLFCVCAGFFLHALLTLTPGRGVNNLFSVYNIYA